MSFEGKYFIITGAAGAIAEPLIERLFSQKANLLLIDVKEDKLEIIQSKYNSDRLTIETSELTSKAKTASLNSVLDVPVPVAVVTAICSPCVIVAS